MLATPRAANLADRGVEAVQSRRDRTQQGLAVGGERHMASPTRKERRTQLLFQAADLAADGGLGEVQLFSGSAKTQ